MSKKDFEKLSEAELLEKIAQAEKKESKLRVWGLNSIFIGLLVTVIGVVLDIGEFALIFGVIALVGAILYIASIRLRGKTESQVNAHLDDFYEAELNRVLGPRMKTSEMHISRSFMEKFHPVDERWNECQVWRYYESNYHGIHFSVANVELVERRKEGENADRIETKFEGVVLRCKDICDPALDIALRGNRKDHRQSDLISPAIFNQHFSARTADDQPADDLVTPQLRELVQKLESVDNREMVDLKIQQLRNSLSGAEKLEKKHKKLASGLADDVREKIQKQEDNVGYVPITSLTLHDGEATLAVNGYIYADGLNGSLKNLDIVRKRFITSLYPLERMISVLHDYRGKI